MVEMTSPGVYVTEVDMSEIVPTVSSSTTVFGGNFTKGPVETYTEITSVDDLIEFYGLPTNDNYNDWYQCYNFLQYGNRLLVSRACNLNGRPCYTTSTYDGISGFVGYGTIDYGTYGYGEGKDDQKIIVNGYGNLKEGDVIGFVKGGEYDPATAIDQSETIRYLVVKVETRKNDSETPIGYTLKLDKDLDLPPAELARKSIDKATQEQIEEYYNDHTQIIKIFEHHNGSCEALVRNNHALKDNKPYHMTWKTESIKYTAYLDNEKSIASADNKVYYSIPVFVPNALDGTQTITCEDDNDEKYGKGGLFEITDIKDATQRDAGILFDTNITVLNPNDFDYKYNSGSIAFACGANSKLKFITRTPGTASALYSIAIALPSDFAANDTEHVGNHCPRYAAEGITVDSLFEYAPAPGTAQIAVVICDTVKGTVKEKYLCSLDPKDIDNFGNSMFIEKVINRASNCVYVVCDTSTPATIDKVHPYTSDTGIGEWTLDESVEVVVPNIESYVLYRAVNVVYDDSSASTSSTNYKVKYNYIGRVLNFHCASDSDIQADDLLNAYEVFENKDLIDVDIIIANELDNAVSAKNLAESRLDCIAYMGIPYEYNEEGIGVLAVSRRSADATSNIVKFRNAINYNTDRVSLVANYKYQYDRYNDTYRWINFAGDVAGLRAKTNQELAPWWASAGLNRGQLRNVVKIAYNPNQTQRNTLYTKGINPIVDFPGQGIVLWGQKTMLDRSSSFDRVNCRCLFLKNSNDDVFSLVA